MSRLAIQQKPDITMCESSDRTPKSGMQYDVHCPWCHHVGAVCIKWLSGKWMRMRCVECGWKFDVDGE